MTDIEKMSIDDIAKALIEKTKDVPLAKVRSMHGALQVTMAQAVKDRSHYTIRGTSFNDRDYRVEPITADVVRCEFTEQSLKPVVKMLVMSQIVVDDEFIDGLASLQKWLKEQISGRGGETL